MTPLMRKITAALAGKRFSLEDEKRTQELIADALLDANLSRVREFALRDADGKPLGAIDFMVPDHAPLGPAGIGLEIKIKGAPAAIVRQLRRYASSPNIKGLVLATSKPVACPDRILDKPVAVFNLAEAWL